MNDLFVKIIKRASLVSEPKEIAKLIYCSDTEEAFFDENTITRICLGKIRSVNSSTVLPTPTFEDIGTFIVGISTLDLHYLDDTLVYRKVETRDDMYCLIGEPERFRPHNLTKNGQLIAPRTLASCVYDDYGTPIGEALNYVQDWIDNIIKNGIPAEWITTGLINVSRIPKSAQMDFKIVANRDQRLQLTIDDVQNGDVVQETETYRMYFIVDETKLGTDAAFREFTVGNITWQQVLQRPLSLTLNNGAVGSVSLETGPTIASQKLSMDVYLNMDYANSGILKAAYGGTGTQDGTAPYVKLEDTTDKIYVAGKRADGKAMNYSSEVEISGGIITANGIHTDESSIISSFAGGINVKNGIIDSTKLNLKSGLFTIASSDGTSTSGQTTIFGDSRISTKIYGTVLNLCTSAGSIYFYTNNDFKYNALRMSIDKSAVKITPPLNITSLEISSLSNVSAKINTDTVGWKTSLNGRVRSYAKSVSKAMVINTTNFIYAFRASDSLVDNTPTNLFVIEPTLATFEVPTLISNTFKVYGESTFLSKVAIENTLNVEKKVNFDFNHSTNGSIEAITSITYPDADPRSMVPSISGEDSTFANTSIGLKFYHNQGKFTFGNFTILPSRIIAESNLDVYGNIRSKNMYANDANFSTGTIVTLAATTANISNLNLGNANFTNSVLNGIVNASALTFTSNINFADPGYNTFRGIAGGMASSDKWRVGAFVPSNDAGVLELATADNGTELICVRQYSGANFTTLVRQANLLDGNGNTSFPGTVTAKAFSGNATSATNADKLDGYHAADFVRKSELTAGNSTVSPVVVSATEPAKRANGLWVNTSNGLLYYCASASSAWTPVSSRWA